MQNKIIHEIVQDETINNVEVNTKIDHNNAISQNITNLLESEPLGTDMQSNSNNSDEDSATNL